MIGRRPRWSAAADHGGADLPRAAAAAGLAAWFWFVVGINHPARGFDRLRRYGGVFSLVLPNWRFFAPEPALHDSLVLYRLCTATGAWTPWRELDVLFPERRWWNVAFHPGNRRAKALIDIVNLTLVNLDRLPLRAVHKGAVYRVLEAFVGHEIRLKYAGQELARRFQFAIVRFAGYDEEPEPEYLFLSPSVPLTMALTRAGQG